MLDETNGRRTVKKTFSLIASTQQDCVQPNLKNNKNFHTYLQ